MSVLNQLTKNALAFSFVSFVLIALHLFNYSVWIPSIYHFYTFTPMNGYFALDQISVVNTVAFLFLSSLIFFGYFSPFAVAYVTAQLFWAYFSGSVSIAEFSILIPGFLALYSGLVLADGISRDFNHRGIVYSQLRRGLTIFGFSVVVTFIFVMFRFSVINLILSYL